MFLTVEQVIELGVSRANIHRKMAAGEWASREVETGRNGSVLAATELEKGKKGPLALASQRRAA